MPKERVYGRRIADHPDLAYDLSIQWDKASEAHEYDEDGLAGHVSISMVEQTSDDVRFIAYFDRTALNKLIRTAMKARDQAFGSDA
jgi:hypothetical protein